MNNKQGKSSPLGFLGGAVIVVAVILFRVYRDLGPENFNVITIIKYICEMALVVGMYVAGSAIYNSEKIKSPFTAILIIADIFIGMLLIRFVWMF